jgi:hypothetical protein
MFRIPILQRALAAILLTALSGAPAHGGVATFENFNEGDFFFPSFTDPLSGIFFAESTGPDPGEWVIEFTGPLAGLPTISPGNYLVSVGYAPGPGASLPYQFGMRGVLPELADRVFMTVAYASDPGASITMEGFDDAGSLVATTTIIPPLASFRELEIGVVSSSVNIRSFRVTPTNIFVGYDNITFVPEPGAAIVAACPLVLLRRRR